MAFFHSQVLSHCEGSSHLLHHFRQQKPKPKKQHREVVHVTKEILIYTMCIFVCAPSTLYK